MNANEFGGSLGHSFAMTGCNAVEGTTIFTACQDVCEMVRSYWLDGTTFLEKGDTINAVAAFGYAFGWLSAGQLIGVIMCRYEHQIPWVSEIIPADDKEKLNRKTMRYFQMLTFALHSLSCASENSTCLWKGAQRVLIEARNARKTGMKHCINDRRINALIWFSYGHGWLDASVRIGLFEIRERRELFTI